MIGVDGVADAAQADTHAPASGGRCGGADAARPMACHIGHISPQVNQDGCMRVEIWDKDVRIKRPCHVVNARPSVRGKVKGMSCRSRLRLRWAVDNTPELRSPKTFFVCLTYPAEWPKDGRIVKRHLDNFGKRCVRVNGFFAWVLEYQTRGAPHFHLLARFPDDWDIAKVREWVAVSWFEIVGSGDGKHLRAGTSVELVKNSDGAGWYLSRYLGKEYQKQPPEDVLLPGRMWGMKGIKPPEPKVMAYKAGSKDGIKLARLIRRWAASDFAFRQRQHVWTKAERMREAKMVKSVCPGFYNALVSFGETQIISEVKPEKRKSWSPRDSGREKGFSVRNAAKVARLFCSVGI
mgnify:FL=1